jgi:APA family basic amino acid/polyamine antiporter
VMIFDTLNNALVASTIFILRKRGVTSSAGAPYRVPFYPVLPAVFVAFLLTITVNVILSQPDALVFGGGILLAGYPVFLLMRRVSRITNAMDPDVKEEPK